MVPPSAPRTPRTTHRLRNQPERPPLERPGRRHLSRRPPRRPGRPDTSTSSHLQRRVNIRFASALLVSGLTLAACSVAEQAKTAPVQSAKTSKGKPICGCTAREYFVIFHGDRSTLSAQALKDIALAAAYAKYRHDGMSIYGYSKVSVNLIVDRTLSLQRATAVKRQLLQDGAPKSPIFLRGFGENDLLFPIGPNTPYDQTGYVTIDVN